MFNLKDISKAIDQIAEEKGLNSEDVLSAIEFSLAAAYKKEYGSRGEMVRAKFNPKSGDLKFWQVKTVVDDTTVRMVEDDTTTTSLATEEELLPRYNSDRHIL